MQKQNSLIDLQSQIHGRCQDMAAYPNNPKGRLWSLPDEASDGSCGRGVVTGPARRSQRWLSAGEA
ncbi:MAG: hypothetical protein M3Y60_01975 [Bacteroidota bacterium]|nr:hypothetical protein [Bacteroidota bacterium]